MDIRQSITFTISFDDDKIFKAEFSETEGFTVRFTDGEAFKAKFAESENAHPIYDGSYVIVPKVVQQNLDTEDKLMMKDVTCLEIPFSSVSNPADGLTVTIGGIL